MKRLLLVGYYGFDNLGDELVLLSTLEFIKTHYPLIKPVVLYNKDLDKIYGADVIHRKNLVSGIRRFDAICFAGGSIFQDITSLKSLLYYLGIVFFSFLFGKSIVMISQGIGPIDTSIGKRLMRLVNLVDSISVRDQGSKELLLSLGIKRPSIYIGGDLALFYEPKETGTSQFSKEDIIISVRDFSGFNEEALVSALEEVKERTPFNFCFLVSHKREDLDISKRFAKRIGGDIFFWDHIEDVINLISSSRLVLGMRLHPLVLSALLDVPFIGIAYDPKVSAFSSVFPKIRLLSLTESKDAIKDAIISSLDNREALKNHIRDIKEKLLKKEEETFRPIDELYNLWFKNR
ncbi:MAG: polysaccharide pyruvyl transferase CsaB [bacterium]